MKRLVYPILLVAVSLVIGAILTTITAATFASYSKDKKNSSVVVDEQLTDASTDNTTTGSSFSVTR